MAFSSGETGRFVAMPRFPGEIFWRLRSQMVSERNQMKSYVENLATCSNRLIAFDNAIACPFSTLGYTTHWPPNLVEMDAMAQPDASPRAGASCMAALKTGPQGLEKCTAIN